MSILRVGSIGELNRRLRTDMRARRRRIQGATLGAAREGRQWIVANTEPVAFGGLRDGTRAESRGSGGARIVADAPYSEAVEKGSRPHWMPLAPLIAWVKLRGMQGLKSPKQVVRLRGSTTARHAASIAEQIRNHTFTDGNDAVAIDAPEQIARAIQRAIAKRGTKPTWFMRQGVPATEAALDRLVKAALPDT